MEKLLHYTWKHKFLPLGTLTTTDGKKLEIVNPGLSNMDAGPDFFNAQVKMDGVMWAGNVELHLRASDWYKHGHQDDPAYDNVILHVVTEADMEVTTHAGKQLPQLEISIPEKLKADYHQLLTTMDYPRCHRLIPQFDRLKVHAWMDALLDERITERAGLVLQRWETAGHDWEKAYLITLARNFGFSLNGDVFERWARIMPFYACAKHRNNLFQIQALFLGVAGLLDKGGDERMKQEYKYLKHKFDLTDELNESDWKYMRTRPHNFPHVRLQQLAVIFQSEKANLSSILETESLTDLYECFRVAGITQAAFQLIVINTVVPVLCAYGKIHHEESYRERAIHLLETIKAENNRILRQWSDCGLKVSTAADSQALIQLKRQYCDRADCLRCRFGYEYLKSCSAMGTTSIK